LEGRLFPDNQSYLKSFQKALIGHWQENSWPLKKASSFFGQVNTTGL